jgi:hypothetical protein
MRVTNAKSLQPRSLFKAGQTSPNRSAVLQVPELLPTFDLRLRQDEILAQLHEEPVALTRCGKAANVLVNTE